MHLTLSSEKQASWQRMVNLLARVMDVAAVRIMQLQPGYMVVLVASHNHDDSCKAGNRIPLHTGLYCETVIKQRRSLYVPEASSDPQWESSPDLKRGITCYLGYPIHYPDQTLFGTLCVLDHHRNPLINTYQDLLVEFRAVIERDLQLMADLEQQRAIAETLRQSEQRFQALVELAPDPLIIVDDHGYIVNLNRATERLFRYAREELIGQSVDLLLPLQHREAHQKQRRDFMSKPAVRPMGVRQPLAALTKEGQEIRVAVSLSPFQIDAGSFVAASILDVSNRYRMEEMFRTIFEELNDAYLFFDQSGIIDCNSAALKILGARQKSDLIGLHPAAFSPELQPDGRRSLGDKEHEMIQKTLEKGTHVFEWLHQRLDNAQPIYCRVTLKKLDLIGKVILLAHWSPLVAESTHSLKDTAIPSSLEASPLTCPCQPVRAESSEGS